jgi:hypothetical protein
MRSYNPQSASTWVWAVPISLAATFGISVIYFPPGTEMVHFPGLAHTRLCIQRAVTGVHPAGFPHSEILGSKPACGSPRLIAACHVLHRLLAPRHPPYALSSLIIKLTQSVLAVRRNLDGQVHPRFVLQFRRPDCLRLHIPCVSALLELGRSRRTGHWLSYPHFIRQLFELPLFSTVLLNSSKLVINPHHGVPADRNPVGIVGVDLPAFLLSKSVCPDPVRAPQHSAAASPGIAAEQ